MNETQTVVVTVAGVLILMIVAARFVAMCLADLDHTTVVRVFPRRTWRLLILFWIPFGGILYLMYGRPR